MTGLISIIISDMKGDIIDNLFIYEGNGLLYRVYKVKQMTSDDSCFEAHPFNHEVYIGDMNGHGKPLKFKDDMSTNDFRKAFV